MVYVFAGITAVAQEASTNAVVLDVKGVIGVATTEYVSDGLGYAREINAQSLIILLDTPGGSLDATFEIVRLIERSEVPVITFVYPQGATGWSAGVFILLSSHVAAMAPGTVIGSSQPVSFPGGEPIDDPKIINSLTQFLVERAGLHGRNETAAAEFVRENLNLGADQAEQFGVIEIKASTVESMMNLVDGLEVEVFERGRMKLQTAGAKLVNFNPSIRSMVLGFISEPTLAYLLFTLGVWILIFGLATTGPTGEVIGGILLVLGLIGLGFTVDLLVLFLLLVGGIFIVVEMLHPGLQIFGPAGIVCLVLGSLLLLRLDPSRWLVSQEWYTFFFMVVVGVVAVMTGFACFILYKVFRLPKQRKTLKWVVGETGRTIDALKQGQEGYVQVGGEYWKAKANVPVEAGQIVTVVSKEGPTLIVEPKKES
ncbi:MAG TPA: nodulation protein NfeD [Candidatus Bathyarchaeia archaeon]|nr:nodulation protein NfeD [Candidatus Bathyarchaeia archaeon]